MAMKTRAFLVKDIDSAVLERLLGEGPLLLNSRKMNSVNITMIKHQFQNLLMVIQINVRGGGLDRSFANPLYKEKVEVSNLKQLEVGLKNYVN